MAICDPSPSPYEFQINHLKSKVHFQTLDFGPAKQCKQNRQWLRWRDVKMFHLVVIARALIVPASSILSLSDTDEKCSMLQSPQHYHTVCLTCYRMTTKCWLCMMNVTQFYTGGLSEPSVTLNWIVRVFTHTHQPMKQWQYRQTHMDVSAFRSKTKVFSDAI